MAKGSFRSLWARNVGGAEKPTDTTPRPQGGDRSFLFFWGGGAAKPPVRGDYAAPCSMLAFWMGGANLPPFVPLPAVSFEDGVSYAKHHGPARRYPIDDEEVIEILEWWTAWNDIE